MQDLFSLLLVKDATPILRLVMDSLSVCLSDICSMLDLRWCISRLV